MIGTGQWQSMLAFVLGVLVVLVTVTSLIRTLVIPRALPSFITTLTTRVVVGAFWLVARLRRTYDGRDAVLAWSGPVSILVTLIVWLILFALGYALMLFGISELSLGEALKQAGSSLFTLGFANSQTVDETFVDFAAAATGPIVTALLIGFLPTLYSLYTSREVDMALLATRAGEPSWGPELLSRVALDGALDDLPALWRQWERWAATVRLTQTTYPVLNRLRSSRGSRHWVISLLAVMDAASLQLALTRSLPRSEALGLVVQGTTSFEVLYAADRSFGDPELRAMRRAGLPPETRTPPGGRVPAGPQRGSDRELLREVAAEAAAQVDQAMAASPAVRRRLTAEHRGITSLTRADFDEALDLLRRSDFPIDVDPDEGWRLFAELRGQYEQPAYGLARFLYATPAPWSGERHPPLPAQYPMHAVDVAERADHDGGSAGSVTSTGGSHDDAHSGDQESDEPRQDGRP